MTWKINLRGIDYSDITSTVMNIIGVALSAGGLEANALFDNIPYNGLWVSAHAVSILSAIGCVSIRNRLDL